jgi:hypothetical protein
MPSSEIITRMPSAWQNSSNPAGSRTPLLSSVACSSRPAPVVSLRAYSWSFMTREWLRLASPPAYFSFTAENPWATADLTTASTAARPTDSPIGAADLLM